MKNFAGWKEVVLIVVSIGFTLLLGEVGARLLLPQPYRIIINHVDRARGMPVLSIDPQIGWVNAPEDRAYHFQATSHYGATDAVYHVQNGFRAASAHPVTGPVLLTAGCSFTFGVGVSDADTWPWIVQEQLPDYKVVNAGTNNYGSIQALMRADQVISQAHEPLKVVVLGFAEFHLERDRASQAYLFNSYPAGRPRFVKQGDHFVDKGLVYFWAPGALLQKSSLLMHVLNRAGDIGTGTPGHDASRDITLGVIQDFAAKWKRQNIALVVVMLPNSGDRKEPENADHNFMLAGLQKAGIPVYVPDFPRMPDGSIERSRFLINSDAFHPNRNYNVLLAGGLSGFLKSGAIH